MEILYQDEHFFAIDKPAGHFVHPPERSRYPVPADKICLYQLRDQMRQEVYPVHRLDAPTTGVVLFATSKEATRNLSRLFAEREVTKTYQAVVRGFADRQGSIDLPLEIVGFEHLNESRTDYQTDAYLELPVPVGKKYPTARYSLVTVRPQTGRWHQIRRHFDRIAHPLIGDIEHGDSHHNRFFRDHLKIPGLCLRAWRLAFQHPWSQKAVVIEAPQNEKWEKIHALFNCSQECSFKGMDCL